MAIRNKIRDIQAKREEFISMLEDMPYSRVDTYIDKKVTSLASAKVYLKKLTKIVLYLVKEND